MNDEQLRNLEKNSKLYKRLQTLFKEDDVLWNNEIVANLFVSSCLLILAIVLVISYVLAYFGVFDVPLERMASVLITNIPLLLFGNIISAVYKGQKHWIKYILCIISITTVIGLCTVISIFVTIIICIPVVLSCRYYSRKFTITVSFLTILGMVISEVLYAKFGMVNLNLVGIPEGSVLNITNGLRDAVMHTQYSQSEYLINLFRGSFMPRLLLFSIVSMVCVELARRASEMVIDQAEISKKTEGVKAELNMATNIQKAVLKKTFPAFPSKPELDIYSSMLPAREVGGDFYDYYLIDDDHLLLLIADVSGKGIPAALFMMISKILLKTHANLNNSPARIISAVNEQLCEGNEVDMFVTVWLGILELSTGVVTAVDAGHEYPAVRHKNGDYEYIKGKKSLVVAAMEGTKFNEYTFYLEKGDSIFLYTDGIPEATNNDNKMYGCNRLLDVLNKHKDMSSKELIEIVTKDVAKFVEDAPQFDDMTMVALHYDDI